MRPFERRAASAYPYFKLARWDALNATWREGKRAYPTEAAARADANLGKFRISEVTATGRNDKQFEVSQ